MGCCYGWHCAITTQTVSHGQTVRFESEFSPAGENSYECVNSVVKLSILNIHTHVRTYVYVPVHTGGIPYGQF